MVRKPISTAIAGIAGGGELRGLARYTLINAPWTLIASFAQPLSNYVTILLLSSAYGLEAGGQFRLLLSIFGVLTPFTLPDTGKVAVRYLVQNREGVIRPLLACRIRWGLAGAAAGLATAAYLFHRGDTLALPVLILALLLPLGESADLYAQINQARQQFLTSAAYSLAKYGALTALAFVFAGMGLPALAFLSSYFIVLFGFNIYFLSRHPETFEASNAQAPRYVREGIQLSSSGVFPILLEHADKFIVSCFLGLEALALYSIGVSTGRLFLNVVKPVLTIYFPILVNHRPNAPFLLGSFVALTALGIAAAIALKFYFLLLLDAQYMPSYPFAAVIVSGLGLFFVGVVIYYSAVYHKTAEVRIPAITNVLTFALVTAYLLASARWGGPHALLLCAASFPLRDLIGLLVIGYLSKRAAGDA